MPTDESSPLKYPFFVNQPELVQNPIERSRTINAHYLYRDGERYVMMDSENFDQIEISEAQIASAKLLKEGQENITITFVWGFLIEVRLPDFVQLQVASISRSPEAGSDVLPLAVLETGAQVTVPPDISPGQIIRINTRTGCYSPL